MNKVLEDIAQGDAPANEEEFDAQIKAILDQSGLSERHKDDVITAQLHAMTALRTIIDMQVGSATGEEKAVITDATLKIMTVIHGAAVKMTAKGWKPPVE
jgi:hypothetical protein